MKVNYRNFTELLENLEYRPLQDVAKQIEVLLPHNSTYNAIVILDKNHLLNYVKDLLRSNEFYYHFIISLDLGYLELKEIQIESRAEVKAKRLNEEALKAYQERKQFESDAILYFKSFSFLKRLKLTFNLL